MHVRAGWILQRVTACCLEKCSTFLSSYCRCGCEIVPPLWPGTSTPCAAISLQMRRRELDLIAHFIIA